MRKKIYLVLIALCCAFNVNAFIVLPDVITDNMVLQQKEKSTFWGKAAPGKSITIIPSWNNKKYSTTIDANGNWKIRIDIPAAGGPFQLSFNDGELLVLKNIMIGEVWLCSGQSNMEMPLAGWGKIKNYQQEIANANYPNIRILKVKKTINSHPQHDFQSNTMGWQECAPSTISDFSATAYFFARRIIQDKNVAIGLIDATWGGTVIESWTSAEAIAKVAVFTDTVRKYASIPAATKLTNPNKPALLFNGMINPLLPVTIKGVIWYQGESNNSRAYQYRELFPLLINDWRTKFGRAKMPFLFVQLANFQAILPQPADATWAELREAQAMALRLPNTGMAVAIDIGETGDIHPKNKQDAGKRLALLALRKVYGQDVIDEGPVYQSYKIEGAKIRISFKPSVAALKTQDGKALTGFAIAGADRKFYWATAEISGNSIIVSSDQVKNPVAVRYAWANNPVCNLINAAALPASPFRTDDWPGITDQKK
ncbi:sialate O-acetylesterase [Pedobacter sp. MR2016-24]|uniref:sialate O-acetylesterase n=1 Tax=Pedobacter sp. MR2016-24 TaxID=2994466 RepID=UPI002246F1BA|nr:sialate O-acetylesterase [Pedobacter sp. MR2016-24]MCX2486204.1 sialate O-acetylesterase [Pedobacter sp. MR2016-24]